MRFRSSSLLVTAVVCTGALASCAESVQPPAGAADRSATTTASTVPAPVPTTSTPPTTVPPTIAVPATTPSTVAPTTTLEPGVVRQIEIGRSVEGRPIVATERGTGGGTVVLVIGSIHGDEDDGMAIVADLHGLDVPAGIDLWLVESMNPDGNAHQVRGNANGVDLNRNFPYNWQPLSVPGDWQYAGPGPASEPETQAVVDFVDRIRPALTVWYHQDLFRISPGEGLDGLIRARYAELTGLPLLRVTGGTYTGVAATWLRQTMPDSVAFIVELGETLSTDEAAVHANAVLDVTGLLTAP